MTKPKSKTKLLEEARLLREAEDREVGHRIDGLVVHWESTWPRRRYNQMRNWREGRLMHPGCDFPVTFTTTKTMQHLHIIGVRD